MIKRLWIKAILVVVVSITSLHFYSASKSVQLFGNIISKIETEQKLVALTFDDGPVTSVTEDILQVLRDKKVTANFFVVGKKVERSPELLKKIIEQGHLVGNHSYSHKRMIYEDYQAYKHEIEYTDRLIRNEGYSGPIHFRSPFGKKLFVVPYILSEMDKLNIIWNVDPKDYKATSEYDIVEHISEQTTPGSIILLHERSITAKSLPLIIDVLREKGFEFATIDQLLSIEKNKQLLGWVEL